MVSVHRVHTHERDDMCSRAEMTDESITQLTDATPGLEDQYRFFQEMRGYVGDLVECLNEKVGLRCHCVILLLTLCLTYLLTFTCYILLLQTLTRPRQMWTIAVDDPKASASFSLLVG